MTENEKLEKKLSILFIIILSVFQERMKNLHTEILKKLNDKTPS